MRKAQAAKGISIEDNENDVEDDEIITVDPSEVIAEGENDDVSDSAQQVKKRRGSHGTAHIRDRKDVITPAPKQRGRKKKIPASVESSGVQAEEDASHAAAADRDDETELESEKPSKDADRDEDDDDEDEDEDGEDDKKDEDLEEEEEEEEGEEEEEEEEDGRQVITGMPEEKELEGEEGEEEFSTPKERVEEGDDDNDYDDEDEHETRLNARR